ncbi:hypothetical protein NX059_011817 [Plenodomus lindquistii]|nr:hypothetical protein NX059_011817 [Plenodomus lindquistii]
MPNPIATSGHPLLSNNPQSQQTDTITARRPSSSHSEPGTSSPLPTKHSEAKRSLGAHHRSGSSKGQSSKLHPASSRSKQRSTASPTAMTSSPSSVNYTRTGRISKAKKGLKVHNCGNCGRSYTRAEHLRRHQKNHAQDGALSCDFPNCDKMFFRIDLLQRHQERHNDPGRMSRHASEFSPKSSSDAPQTSVPKSMTCDAVATPSTVQAFHTPPPPSPVHSHTPIRYNTTQFRTPLLPRASQASTSAFTHVIHLSPNLKSRNQRKHQGPLTGRAAVGVPMQVDETTPGFGWSELHCQSPNYSSSDGYVSPNPASGDHAFSHMTYHSEPFRTRTSSNASLVEPPWSYASYSPASTTSTMAYTWAQGDKTSDLSSFSYPAGTYLMASVPGSNGVDSVTSFCHYGPKAMPQRDEEESVYLFGEHLYGMMDPITHTNPFEQDLDYYWRFFHPTFPVIHRPTFRRVTATPMLLAAMIAIGGQYSSEASVKRKSRDLHDRCVKLLERREQDIMTEPERLQDYQASFIIEVISQFRSRRSAKVLTSRFLKVYSKAALYFRDTTSQIAELISTVDQSNDQSNDAALATWNRWIELISWQRLLQACYILESQQATLLARESASSIVHTTGYDLPLPVSHIVFDAESPREWQSASQIHSPIVKYIYEISPALILSPLDEFQSSVLIAAAYNRCDVGMSYAFPSPESDLGHYINMSTSTTRQYLAAKLIHVTPVRALLAVPGESWIFSEKVPTVEAFSGLRTTLRTWVAQLWAMDGTLSDPPPIKEALQLSITILETALKEQHYPITPEVGTDLSIFYAALVLWAVTTAASTRFQEAHHRSKTAIHRRRKPSQSLSLTSDAGLSITSSPRCSLYQPLNQSLSATNAAPQAASRSFTIIPISTSSQTLHNSTCSLSHTQITINTMTFLSSAMVGFADSAPQSWKPSDLGRCQTGCISMLLWVKLRMRGVPLGHGSADAWSSDSGESLGELLDGITTMLEKMLGRGWNGWGI